MAKDTYIIELEIAVWSSNKKEVHALKSHLRKAIEAYQAAHPECHDLRMTSHTEKLWNIKFND